MTEETIFYAALEKNDPAERAVFLDQACVGDPALRRRVEALLRSHAGSGNFLDVPAVGQASAAGGATRTIDVSADDPGQAPDRLPDHLSRTAVEPNRDEQVLACLAPSREPGSLGRLDRYEVLGVVGRGGMGTVVKARDTSLERVVAIKLLAPQLAASGTARKRFEREAKAAAAVAHEHIVNIHAVETAGPAPYLVMEFVGGITLEDRIKQGGPLEVKEILRIGLQAAKGLAAAHAQGLIHRDIKPGNILLENGIQRVKITDFGLARAADDASLTQSGVIAGTPLFMSPEQASGEVVDHRSDLFSLGSVLYALATGHPPFRAANTMAVLKRVCESTPRPIGELNPDVPDWLCAIIGKLLAKDPAQRFQSAAEVADLLSQHLTYLQQPQLAPKPESITLASRGRGRPEGGSSGRPRPRLARKTLVAAAATLLLAGAALAVFLVFHRGEVKPPLPPPPHGKGTDEAFDRLKREDIPRPLLALAGGGDPDQAPAELVAVLGEARKFLLPDNGARGFMAQSSDGKMLAVPCGDNALVYDVQTGVILRSFRGHTNRVFAVTFSRDGKFLASGAGDGTARVWDMGTGQSVSTCTGHTGVVFAAAFSADNKRLLTGGGAGTGRMWEVETGKELFSLQGHTGGLLDVAFSPDDKHLATAGFDGTTRVWDAETGKESQCLKGHSRNVQKVAFSPDGKLLASGSERELILWNTGTWQPFKTLPTSAGWLAFGSDGQTLLAANHDTGGAVQKLTRWNVTTGKEIASFPLQSQGAFALYAASPDGSILFATRDNPDVPYVRAYDATTGKEPPRRGHEGNVACVAVSPDGKMLASGGADRIVRLWNLAEWKAGEPLPPVRLLEGHNEGVRGIAFSPDSKILITASRDMGLCVWDVASGDLMRTLNGNDVFRMAFSSDGRTLAAGCLDGSVRLWDLSATRDRDGSVLCKHSKRVRCVHYSPDGKWLASGGEDRQLWVTDVATGRLVKRFELTAFVNDVMFSPDGKMLAAVCDAPDTSVHVWNVRDWKPTLLPGHTDHVQSVEFSPVAPLLATAAYDGTVRFWDLGGTSPRALSIGPATFGGHVWQARFTPEGRYLVTANENGTISILKVPSPPVADAPGLPKLLPDPVELAKRPSPADTLKRENIPAELLAKAGGGDPAKAPPELVSVLGGKKGHTNWVLSVAISPDGKLLASTGVDQTVKLWDLATAELSRTLTGHTGDVRSLAFSPDGKLLASAGADGTIKLWEVAAGKERRTLTVHTNTVNRVIFNPDGQSLAAAANDGIVQVWDVTAGRPVRTFQGHQGNAWGVAFSPDGKTLASAGDDRTVRLWDLATGWEMGALQGNVDVTRFVAFHPDGRTLASCGHDRTIRLWDLAPERRTEGKMPLRTLQGHEQLIESFAWRADGRLLASGSADGTLRLWDPTQPVARCQVLKLLPPGQIALHGVAFTPEGRYLATANPDGTVYVLRLAKRGDVHEVPPEVVERQPKASLPAHEGAVTWTAFSADGKSLASAGKDGALKLWNPSPLRLSPEGRGEKGEGKERWSVAAHDGGVRVLTLTADGKTLATAGFDGVIRLWDADGKKLHELPGHQGGVAPLLFTADGEQLLSGGADGCVRFWNVGRISNPSYKDRDGKEANKLDASKDWITHLSLTPDGKTLATSGNDGMVRLWDLASREHQRPEAAKERTALPERTSAAFSPDGKRLAVTTPEHHIKLLDAETLEVRVVLIGHTDGPDSLSFSADGRLLASCGADGAIRVWDARRGHPLAVLRGHKGRVWTVTLTADGKTLAAGGEDGKLHLWNLAGLPGRAAP